MIGSDEYDNIWISVENQGLFCYNHEKKGYGIICMIRACPM